MPNQDGLGGHDGVGQDGGNQVGGRLDPEVVGELFRRHGGELQRFLQGMLGDAQLAADALQAAVVKAIEKGQMAGEETRKAWLFRVAYHEALALKRRDGVGNRVLRTAAWNASSNLTETPEGEIVRREQAEIIREAQSRLPLEQQTVVRMRIHENKTFAQIAAELGIPIGTVQTRMYAALAKLRKLLGEQNES